MAPSHSAAEEVGRSEALLKMSYPQRLFAIPSISAQYGRFLKYCCRVDISVENVVDNNVDKSESNRHAILAWVRSAEEHPSFRTDVQGLDAACIWALQLGQHMPHFLQLLCHVG